MDVQRLQPLRREHVVLPHEVAEPLHILNEQRTPLRRVDRQGRGFVGHANSSSVELTRRPPCLNGYASMQTAVHRPKYPSLVNGAGEGKKPTGLAFGRDELTAPHLPE
jgi:hypothetical protein